MSDSELDYLQPGWNPSTATVPKLRSILVTYDVRFPSNAKKPELIDLFNEHVAPQASKILKKLARAKRSSMGIVDANVQSQGMDDMDDMDDAHDLPPPRRLTRSKSPQKTRAPRQPSFEPEHHQPATRSPTKRQSRSASRQLPDVSDQDDDSDAKPEPVAPSRRARTKTPQVKMEPADEEPMVDQLTGDESVFTSDNPFQSGSSPPATVKTPSNRRKTTGMEQLRSGAASTNRRRTDGPISSGPTSRQTSRTFEIPMKKIRQPVTPDTFKVEAGEEFTPDAQLELQQELAEDRQLQRSRDALVLRAKPRGRSSLTTPLWVLLIALLGTYAGWYRQQKINVGYCGVGGRASSLIPENVELPQFLRDLEVPEWASVLVEPYCEPCPAHAYCYDDFSVRCEQDYVLKPHPLSLGGVVPLPPTCEPDGEKVRRVKVVADKAVEELRDRRAKFECGELVDEDGKRADSPAIEEQVLKEVISEKRTKKMDKQEFDDLWTAALGEIEEREEVEVEVEGDRTTDSGRFQNPRLSSTSLARLPLRCALRRSLLNTLARYRLHLSVLIASVIGLLYGKSRYQNYRTTSAQIPSLVDVVLERLASQKDISYEDDNEDGFLFLPNLRDDVLRSTHSLAERERIWHRVRAVVEQNSNVRTAQREGLNGEVGRAWEWIGPSGSGESSARRRRSGRVSWGGDIKGAVEDVPSPSVDVAENRTEIHKKWQEARPVF